MTEINFPNNAKMPGTLGDLSPENARLCLWVEKFCLSRLSLKKGSNLVLAISGGADSTALAIIFQILKPRLDLSLFAMHIDHGLREESAGDAIFVKELCKRLCMPCQVEFMDTRSIARREGRGLEDAGRAGRQRLLERFRNRQNASHIVMAHHAGDLGEDIIMRLIRGTGWPALGGMRAHDGHILRPLLFINPQRLKDFLLACDIPWREDESNYCLDFRRNRIRHQVMPDLHKENPSLLRGLAQLNEMAELDRSYWEMALEKALAIHPWKTINDSNISAIILPAPLLAGLHPAARMRLYHKAARQLYSCSLKGGQVRADTLFRLERAYTARSTNSIFQFPGNLEARIRGREIIFELHEDLEQNSINNRLA